MKNKLPAGKEKPVKKLRLVRLSNGEIYNDDRIGANMVALRRMSTEHLPAFVLLCKWESRVIATLPKTALEVAVKFRLVYEKDGEMCLYDDVRDTLRSAVKWDKNSVSLSANVLDKNQTNIVAAPGVSY